MASKRAFILAGWMGLALCIGVWLFYDQVFKIGAWGGEAFVIKDLDPCRIIEDRNGRLLRFVPDASGRRHIPVDGKKVSPLLVKAFLAAEDHRFFSHPGVDVLAVLRAIKDNVWAGRIVSGASTLTQQLIRMDHPRKRSFAAKIREMIQALQLESRISKSEILGLYLNRVPMGGNIVGVEAASRYYFGKSADGLDLAEAALLASLPKAPGRLNPYGSHRKELEQRRNWVLSRMEKLGFVTRRERSRAQESPIELRVRGFPFRAPHFVDFVLKSISRSGTIRTTLDLTLQRRIQAVVKSHASRLESLGVTQAAVVVLDNRDMGIRAMVGSVQYGFRHQGFNNGAVALRSPGSALKPFLYALALDHGYTAATLLDDQDRAYMSPQGPYRPVNYDRNTYGPVSFRTALANSLNLASVHLLNRLGTPAFFRVLQGLHLINDPNKGPNDYGLGMVLGDLEVSLLQLTAAYAALANGGVYRPPRFLSDQVPREGIRLFSPQASTIVLDILSDPMARRVVFRSPDAMNFSKHVAVKTGTSTGYRDAWIVGVSSRETIGVWVGNFDGKATRRISGAVGAAPILRDILKMRYSSGAAPAPFPNPPGLVRVSVCSFSGMKPGPHCPHVRREVFMVGTEPTRECTFHVNRPLFHKLPVEYAGWLYDRYRAGLEGRYRLRGFPTDLARVFSGSGRDSRKDPAQKGVGVGRLSQTAPIRIVSPLPGEHFVLEKESRPVRIQLRAQCRKAYDTVTWVIDGFEYAKAPPPYSVEWPLSVGFHRIQAISPDGVGSEINIHVE